MSDYKELRKKSPRRITAAVRAVRRIEDKNYQSLFDRPKMNDDEVLEKANDRVDYYTKVGRKTLIEDRKNTARSWLLIRRIRRRIPEVIRQEFDRKWQSKIYPGKPEYVADLLNSLIRAYYFEKELFIGE